MSYLQYVIAAYGVFVVVLLWDFVATRVRIRYLMRVAKAMAARKPAAPVSTGELQR